MKFSLVFGLISYISIALAEQETLVLVDNLNIRETHSQFFKSLHDRGYTLTFKLADDANLVLSKYGEYLYKNLIVFAPSVLEFGGQVDTEAITKFIDDGGNLLMAGNAAAGDVYREIASECGFEMDVESAAVIDHFNYDVSDEGDHTRIVVSPKNLIKSPTIVGEHNTQPLLFEGTGLILDKENSLVLPILTADSTAYSYNPKSQEYGIYPFYPRMYPTLFVIGMVGYSQLGVRRDVALCRYVWRVLRGQLHHPEVLETLRLCAPDEAATRRRGFSTLWVPVTRTNLLKFAPTSRAIVLLNLVAEKVDIYSCSLAKFTEAAQNVCENFVYKSVNIY